MVDDHHQSAVRQLPVEWQAQPEWYPHITVIQSPAVHRRMGYEAWLRAKPVALVTEMPLTEVREQRILALLRCSRTHKIY